MWLKYLVHNQKGSKLQTQRTCHRWSQVMVFLRVMMIHVEVEFTLKDEYILYRHIQPNSSTLKGVLRKADFSGIGALTLPFFSRVSLTVPRSFIVSYWALWDHSAINKIHSLLVLSSQTIVNLDSVKGQMTCEIFREEHRTSTRKSLVEICWCGSVAVHMLQVLYRHVIIVIIQSCSTALILKWLFPLTCHYMPLGKVSPLTLCGQWAKGWQTTYCWNTDNCRCIFMWECGNCGHRWMEPEKTGCAALIRADLVSPGQQTLSERVRWQQTL